MPSAMFRLLLLLATSMLKIAPAVSQQSRDTSLLTLYSKPSYYNVVTDWNGDVYAGTTEGVYRMDGPTPVMVKDWKGYLRIDSRGRIAHDSNGVRFHQQSTMSHLLPFPDEKKNEYHAGRDPYFYITSGGRMHVYEVRPYGYLYRNHSIRTITKNFVGTYSGIYYRNKLMPAPVPNFTDGYIREWNGKVFICKYGLDIFDMKMLEGAADGIRQLPVEGGEDLPPCRDIKYLDTLGKYLICSGNKLVMLDSNLKNNRVIFTGEGNAEVVLLHEYPTNQSVSFSQGNKLYTYDATSGRIRLLTKADQPILDGHARAQGELFLTSNALLELRDHNTIEHNATLERAHTICQIGEMDYVISTDLGLFHYSLQNNRLSTLILGVEFNRRALHLEGRKLYAGSINGLYVLDLDDIDHIIAFHKRINQPGPTKTPSWVVGLLLVLVAGLMVVVYRYRGRVRRMEQVIEASLESDAKGRITREEIESFIRDNLSTASLKTIVAHFKTNTSMIYRLLEPEKPGDLIQELRYLHVKTLRSEGKTAREIAGLTGLSETYVRKIWKA